MNYQIKTAPQIHVSWEKSHELPNQMWMKTLSGRSASECLRGKTFIISVYVGGHLWTCRPSAVFVTEPERTARHLYDKRQKVPYCAIIFKTVQTDVTLKPQVLVSPLPSTGTKQGFSRPSRPRSHFAHRKHNLDCIISATPPPVIETGGRGVNGDVCEQRNQEVFLLRVCTNSFFFFFCNVLFQISSSRSTWWPYSLFVTPSFWILKMTSWTIAQV